MKIFRRHSFVTGFCLLSLLVSQTATIVAQRPLSPADREKYAEAVALFHEGNALSKEAAEDKKRAAVEKFTSAADIFHRIGSRSEEANTLNAAANIFEEIYEKHRAIDLYLWVVSILSETGDKANLALTLNNVGAIVAGVGVPL